MVREVSCAWHLKGEVAAFGARAFCEENLVVEVERVGPGHAPFSSSLIRQNAIGWIHIKRRLPTTLESIPVSDEFHGSDGYRVATYRDRLCGKVLDWIHFASVVLDVNIGQNVGARGELIDRLIVVSASSASTETDERRQENSSRHGSSHFADQTAFSDTSQRSRPCWTVVIEGRRGVVWAT